MIFDLMLGDRIPEKCSMNERQAVRAVIFYGDKLLMVKTNRGDYKFPGGGRETDESYEDALVREVLEETGYRVKRTSSLLGTVFQQYPDKFEAGKYFRMTSFYYLGELSNLENEGQQLDDYEAKQNFTTEFITLDDAVDSNLELLASDTASINDWVERETKVLLELRGIWETIWSWKMNIMT